MNRLLEISLHYRLLFTCGLLFLSGCTNSGEQDIYVSQYVSLPLAHTDELTYTEAAEDLFERSSRLSQERIVLRHGTEEEIVSFAEVGIEVDVFRTIENLYEASVSYDDERDTHLVSLEIIVPPGARDEIAQSLKQLGVEEEERLDNADRVLSDIVSELQDGNLSTLVVEVFSEADSEDTVSYENSESRQNNEVDSIIVEQEGLQDVTPVLIAEGRSDFSGSPSGRTANIIKGLFMLSGAILLPGEGFSFNETIGPVTRSRGWQDALAIFGGSELRPTPGGGLCQVSTTLFRAALSAGLPILERSPHSMYIHYYRAFGDGLDAAIFPGVKDLRFRNDTQFPIRITTEVYGSEAIVRLYGVPDGREVMLVGPSYYGRVIEEFVDILSPKPNEIHWISLITNAEGVFKIPIVSRYLSIVRPPPLALN